MRNPFCTIDIISSFRKSMLESRLSPPDNIFLDGNFYRYHVPGDKPGSKNAWYIGHNKGQNSVLITGNWKQNS